MAHNIATRFDLIGAVGGGVVDLKSISFQFRCIYFCRYKRPFGVVGAETPQVSAVFRLNFAESFWFDGRCRRRRCRCTAYFFSISLR